MDRTELFQRLFQESRTRRPASSEAPSSPLSSSSSSLSPSSSSSLLAPPSSASSSFRTVARALSVFLDPLRTLERTVLDTTAKSRAAVYAAIVSMDETLPCLQDVSAELQGHDSQLAELSRALTKVAQSIAASVGVAEEAHEFNNSVDGLESRSKESAEEGDAWVVDRQVEAAGNYMARLLHKVLRKAENETTSASSPPPCLTALRHLHVVALQLNDMVSQERRRNALCCEELEVYRRDMFFFGKCGVLSLDQVDVPASLLHSASDAQRTDNIRDPPQRTDSCRSNPGPRQGGATAAKKNATMTVGDPQQHNDPHNGGDDGEDAVRLGFGGLRQRLATTKGHIESVTRSTRQLVKSSVQQLVAVAPPTTADLGKAIGGALSHEDRKGNSEQTKMRPVDRRVAQEQEDQYSADELAKFQHANQTLHLRLRTSNIRAAKEIETSIRELSHLTSLLQEKSMEQAEQVSLLERNTRDSSRELEKAESELRKPLDQTAKHWLRRLLENGTRQTIVLLWVCTFVLLLSNRLIR